MTSRLAQLDAMLKAFNADIGSATDRKKGIYSIVYEQLEHESESIQRQMDSFKATGMQACSELRSGLEKSYKELSKALHEAAGTFRNWNVAESEPTE